jgi:SpoVK/Ycf46/Vps4 family AAA+-type ATPase
MLFPLAVVVTYQDMKDAMAEIRPSAMREVSEFHNSEI